METIKHIYTDILLNLSINTSVENPSRKLRNEFLKNLKYQGTKSDAQWQLKAYKDFNNLCADEIDKLQELQRKSLDTMEFIINQQ